MPSATPTPPASWRTVLAALAFPLFMTLALPAAYLAAFHQPAPTDMVVQVVDSGEQARQIAAEIGVQTDGRVDAEVVADVASAKDALADLDSRAAYDPATGDLYVASAGSAAAVQTVTAVFAEVAAETGQTLAVTDVAPLPEEDRIGVTFMFLGLAAVLAGFTTATMLGLALPGLGLRRHLGILAVMSGASAVIGTWIAYGVYGALSSQLVEVGALLAAMAAVSGLIQLGGLRLIGAPMTIVSIILFIILGVPASGAGVPIDMTPGFFGSLQHLLSTSSGLDALRRIVYFDGTGIGADLTTIAVWALAAVGMLALATLKRPKADDAGPLPFAAPTDPAERSLFTRRLTVGVMSLPLLFALVLPLAFVGLFHSPAPQHMPVAVIGSGSTVEQTVAGLEASVGDALDVVVVADAAEARQRIEDLELRGAVDPVTGDVYVASAAGVQASAAATSLLTSVVESGGGTATTRDLAPLPAEDSVGTSSLYLGIGAMVGGFLAAVIVGLVGAGHRVSAQALVVTAMGVLSAGVQVLWGWGVFDVFDGNALAGFGVLALLSIMIGLVTLAGFRLVGPAQLLITIFGFVLLGVATSGLAVQLDLAPAFYGVVHTFLPTAQGLSAIRDVVYFDGAAIGPNLAVMATWLVAAIAGLVLAARRSGRGEHRDDLSDLEAAEEEALRDALAGR